MAVTLSMLPVPRKNWIKTTLRLCDKSAGGATAIALRFQKIIFF
jgi:hypothetical protein